MALLVPHPVDALVERVLFAGGLVEAVQLVIAEASVVAVARDRSDRVEVVGPDVMRRNGHCTYLPPDGAWILNDTYPDDERLQHPYLYRVATGERVPLAHLYSPPGYKGEWRCDNHPRYSPDGSKVVVDSTHGGEGRQLYLIDVSGIVA